MAVLFTKRTSEITFAMTLLVIFGTCGYSFGQCLKKNDQKSRCENINNELEKAQTFVKDLKGCLEAECVKIYGSSNEKECKDPPKKVIPGFNTLRINKNLTIEKFLQEITKRIVIHIIQNKEIRQHFKSVKCYKETKLIKHQLNRMKSWITLTQKDLGFSTVIQGSRPPKLTTTGATTAKDWYDVQIQMLINLSLDVTDMRGYFQTSARNNKPCIIPACHD